MKKIIFITPAIPDQNGIGIEKRAYLWYSLLKSKYNIEILFINCDLTNPLIKKKYSLCKIDQFFPHAIKEPFLKRMLLSLLGFIIPSLAEKSPFLDYIPIMQEDKKALKQKFYSSNWDKIFCFRLSISQFALFISKLTNCRNIEIDFDDLESQRKTSLASIYLKNWKFVKACSLFLSAIQYKKNEKSIIPKVNNIYVSADIDYYYLLKSNPSINIEVVHNQIKFRNPPKTKDQIYDKIEMGKKIILFIGNLNYYPNIDAVNFFIKKILPKLNKIINNGWVFRIIGRNCHIIFSEWLKQQNNVEFLGSIDDLFPYYNSCDMVVIPIRGGGGTKLKTIEAIMHSKPIISTIEGVRGLGLKKGVHYYHAETEKEWIRSCLNVLNNPHKSEIMAKEALTYINKKLRNSGLML